RLDGGGGPDPFLTLHLQGVARLSDARSGTELYFDDPFVFVSEPRRFSALSADDARLLHEEVDRGIRALAAAIVDEVFDPVSSWGELRYGTVPASSSEPTDQPASSSGPAP